MKKVVFAIFAVAVVALAAVNLNLVKNDLGVNLTLEKIVALSGEHSTCSICGGSIDDDECTCGATITCDHGWCYGFVCHFSTGDYFCPCMASGDPFEYCIDF